MFPVCMLWCVAVVTMGSPPRLLSIQECTVVVVGPEDRHGGLAHREWRVCQRHQVNQVVTVARPSRLSCVSN